MSHIDPDDVVVAELDVVVGNELQSLHSQLVMLQQPLRPNWRPYDTDRAGISAQFKPQARRLEISLPLDTKGENYGDCLEEHKKIKELKLRSSTVDDSGPSYAVGVVRGNQLMLMPLDYTLQLRPDMSHLNVESNKKKEGEESEDEEAAEEQLTAVEVTVKRRETERQQQARLKSYSYMQQEEQQETWVPLQLHPPDSLAADAIWNKLLSVPEEAAAAADTAGSSSAAAAAAAAAAQQRPMPPTLSRTEYLHAFIPSTASAAAAGDDILGGTAAAAGAGSSAAAAAAGGAAADGGAVPDAGAVGAAAGLTGESVTPEMAAAVSPVFQGLLAQHPVCSMANVRHWLQQLQHEQLVRTAAQLSDGVLDSLLQSTGHVVVIRRMYVAKTGVNAATEGLRKIVVNLLAEKATLRKNDVMTAAHGAGFNPTESQYQRVMKELCRNNGNHWTIKVSADMQML